MPRPNPEQAVDTKGPDAVESAIGGLKFEAALAELEQIVQNMEGGRLPLEESLAAYRRGSQLLQHCQQQLGAAERQIQVHESGTLRDFAANGEDSR